MRSYQFRRIRIRFANLKRWSIVDDVVSPTSKITTSDPRSLVNHDWSPACTDLMSNAANAAASTSGTTADARKTGLGRSRGTSTSSQTYRSANDRSRVSRTPRKRSGAWHLGQLEEWRCDGRNHLRPGVETRCTASRASNFPEHAGHVYRNMGLTSAFQPAAAHDRASRRRLQPLSCRQTPLSKEEHIDWPDNRLSTWPVAVTANSVEATRQFVLGQSREHRITAR